MSVVTHENSVVLIVEDEEDLADVYSQQLADTFAVRVANTAEAALEQLDETVDVVLLDRRLPDSSGRAVLDRIRERELDCRVAMVTGVNPDFSLLDLAVDDYIIKPVSGEELRDRVSLLAELRRFSEPIREYHALAAKSAVIEERMDREELLASDRYRSQILKDVNDHELPEVLRSVLEAYQALDDARPDFMWKWVHKLAPNNTLPCVDAAYRDTVTVDKTLVILFVTILDDLLEKRGDRDTFWELSKLPRPRGEVSPDSDAVNADYVEVGRRVWSLIDERLRESPHYDQFRELWRYDLRQAINAIEYTDLVIRQPDIATMSDLNRYESHNMVMFAYADIDLMYTTADVSAAFPAIRDAVWHAQQMARIGNWVSTWERELREGDVSSGVVIYALENDVIDRHELQALLTSSSPTASSLIDRIQRREVEEYFFGRWSEHYEELHAINAQLDGLDLSSYIEGTEEVLRFHLATRGMK